MVKLEAVSLLNRQICLHLQQDTSRSTKLSFASVATCEIKVWRKTATILCVLHGRKFVSPQNGMHTSSASQILWERCKIDRLAPEDFSLNSSFSDCQHLGLLTKYIVQLCTLRFSFKGILQQQSRTNIRRSFTPPITLSVNHSHSDGGALNENMFSHVIT